MSDDPWLPQMAAINDVLGASDAAEPPMRNADTSVALVRDRDIPSLHLLTIKENNMMDETHLPAPKQLLLVPLTEIELAEMIERHIDYVDGHGHSVHLPSAFVRH